MNCKDLINQGSKILKEHRVSSHLLDSELIMSFLMGKPREDLIINSKQNLNKGKQNRFVRLINRRAKKKEPIAYILNKKDFWNNSLFVDKNTLVPRPETELLVEKIVKIYKNKSPYILDIGTGSGCIIITLLEELKKSKGVAIDISNKALKIAEFNSKKNKTVSRIKFLKKSTDSFFNKKFDIVISNPPYIPRYYLKNLAPDIKLFEPKLALDGGNDGLDVIKKVIYKSRKILKFNGMLGLEIGNGQYKRVSQILKLNSFREKYLIKDFKENVRCILALKLSNH